ncbi:MAG: DinB family protein [Thermomicrobiales bacterium]|nr:DinB family protein [Thermomicrobiales bacterium]
MDILDHMLEHDLWATRELLATSTGLSDAQLDQQFEIGHRTLRATFEHLVFNIKAWTAITAQTPLERFPPGPSLADIAARHDRAQAAFAALAHRLRDDRRLDVMLTDHFDDQQSYGAAVIHALLHNEGHRTEILHILARRSVTEPPEVDHALWDHIRPHESIS